MQAQIVNGVNLSEKREIGYVLISKAPTLRDGDYLDIDYGQNRTSLSKEYVQEQGENKRFYSLVQMFNFMHENGWEFVMQVDEQGTETARLLLDKRSENTVIKYMFRRKNDG